MGASHKDGGRYAFIRNIAHHQAKPAVVHFENIIEIPTDHTGWMHDGSESVSGYNREFMRKDAHLDLSGNLQFMFQALLLDDLELGSLEFIIGLLQLAVLLLQIAE